MTSPAKCHDGLETKNRLKSMREGKKNVTVESFHHEYFHFLILNSSFSRCKR